jgi:hypothetical protein
MEDINLSENKYCSEFFWIETKFGLKKLEVENFGLKKRLVEKKCCLTKILVGKKFWLEKI